MQQDSNTPTLDSYQQSLNEQLLTLQAKHFPPNCKKPNQPWCNTAVQLVLAECMELWSQVRQAAALIPVLRWLPGIKLAYSKHGTTDDPTPALISFSHHHLISYSSNSTNLHALYKAYVTWHQAHIKSKALVRRCKLFYQDQLIQAAEHSAWSQDSRPAWKKIKALRLGKREVSVALRDSQGNVLNEQGEADLITSYMKSTLAAKDSYIAFDLASSRAVTSLSSPLLDIQHLCVNPLTVRSLLFNLDFSKAHPHWTSSPASYFLAHDLLDVPISALISSSLYHKTLPSLWYLLQTIWINKPGKPSSKLDNLRPINLTDPVARVYDKMLQLDLMEAMDERWSHTCYGALPSRSTITALITVQLLSARLRKQGVCHYVFLGDASKAFDLFSRDTILKQTAGQLHHALSHALAQRHAHLHYQTNVGIECSSTVHARRRCTMLLYCSTLVRCRLSTGYEGSS
jgi:hypothetical protein